MLLNKHAENKHLESTIYHFRLSLLIALLIILSLVLVLRLAYLQFYQYKHYATLSLKNQMSIIPIAPPRGIILDKNGIILADNIPVYALEIIPERVKNIAKTIKHLRALLSSITDDDVENFNRAKKNSPAYDSIPFKLKLTQEEVAIFAGNQYKFPGVNIKARLMRYYPLGEITAHVTGYVGRISEQELKQVDPINYHATNFIGKTGIEKFYENQLHGQVGYQQIETDVNGRTVQVVNKQAPIPGEQIYLTLDARLQQAAFSAIKDSKGAVVVLDVRNGDILTMVSSPSFDPNLFVNGISTKNYQQLVQAINRPLYNRDFRHLQL